MEHRIALMTLALGAFALSGCMQLPEEIADKYSAVTYTFTSGPEALGGDGFDWPSENSGLLVHAEESTTFSTPAGITFQNSIGNNLFFDDNYLQPNDSDVGNGIVGEAMWGSPRQIFNDENRIETVVIRIDPPVAAIAFDFSWVLASPPDPANPPNLSFVSIGASYGPPSDTIETLFIDVPLTNRFDAGAVFQDSLGYSGRVVVSVADGAEVSQGIGFVTIFVNTVSHPAAVGQFAVDNFATATADQPF